MTRTVRDTAELLQVMAGYDARDAGSLRQPVPDFVGALDKGVDGLRIGWSADFGYAPADAEVTRASEAAAMSFRELGCEVEESTLSLESPFDTWMVFFAGNAYATNGHLLDDPDDPLTWYGRWTIEQGARYTMADYIRALGERDRMIQQFLDEFEKFDLLLSPTMATTAFPTDAYPETVGGQAPYPIPAWGFLPYTHPINTIGFTAASVPCGFDSDGMPIGLHIIGRPGDEATVLAASAAFEQARPWAGARPPVS